MAFGVRSSLKLLGPSNDPTWLRLTKHVISGANSGSSTVLRSSPMLPGIWQVKKPKLWKSLKFLGNMWTLVCFSAQAGEGGQLPGRCAVRLLARRRMDRV